jgi:hypothetical protein
MVCSPKAAGHQPRQFSLQELVLSRTATKCQGHLDFFNLPSKMRLLPVAAAALIGSVSAIKLTEHDKLANLGLQNVAKDVAKYGYPRPRTCTLKNAAVQKEW